MDQLPDEILQEIFKFLRPTEKLLVSRVCKRFLGVVGSSPELMKNIKIHVRLPNELENPVKEFKDIWRTQRWHQNVEISSRFYQNRTLDTLVTPFSMFLDNVGWKITDLKLQCCSFNASTLLGILHMLPNLEELSFINVCCDDSISTPTKIALENLKHLTLDSPDFQFHPKFLESCRKLISLNVNSNFNFPAKFFTILTQQKKLKHLQLKAPEITENFTDNVNEKIQFKLTTFAMADGNFNVIKLINFLQTQDKLEVLDISRCISIDQIVEINLIKWILEMKNLRILKVPQTQFQPTRTPSQSITELECSLDSRNLMISSQIVTLVNVMPSLRKLILSIDGIFSNDLSHLNNLAHLNFLEIGKAHPSILQHMTIKNLETIIINFLDNNSVLDASVSAFFQNNRNLKKIVLNQGIITKQLWQSINHCNFYHLQFIFNNKLLEYCDDLDDWQLGSFTFKKCISFIDHQNCLFFKARK